jgi:hypothetical protein
MFAGLMGGYFVTSFQRKEHSDNSFAMCSSNEIKIKSEFKKR